MMMVMMMVNGSVHEHSANGDTGNCPKRMSTTTNII